MYWHINNQTENREPQNREPGNKEQPTTDSRHMYGGHGVPAVHVQYERGSLLKKYIIGLIVLALLAGGAYLYLGRGAADVAAPQTAQAAPAVEASSQTIAEAKVVPIRSAALSLASGGMVAEVLVKEGDQVKAG